MGPWILIPFAIAMFPAIVVAVLLRKFFGRTWELAAMVGVGTFFGLGVVLLLSMPAPDF